MKFIILAFLALIGTTLYVLFEERNPKLINGYHLTTFESPMSSAIFKKGGSDVVEPIVVSTAVSGNLIGAISIDPAILQKAKKNNHISSIKPENCKYFIIDTAKEHTDGPLSFLEFSSQGNTFNFHKTSSIFKKLNCPE